MAITEDGAYGGHAGRITTSPVGPIRAAFPYKSGLLVRMLRILVAVPLKEKALIARLRHLAIAGSNTQKRNKIATGIGDDCAVLRLPSGHEALVTTDFSLEGIHFRRDWHPPESVGHRCLARGLSDIASIGGEPVAVFLSLALPRDLSQSWVDRFIKGLLALAEKNGAVLAGGDTAQSPAGVLADIVVIGSVPRGKAILRSAARPGDRIYVSGALGGSAATVQKMQANPKKKMNPRDYPRHFYPNPRIELGQILRRKSMASAMIDTSDGLSTDLAHICEESKVGAEIDAALIPQAKTGKTDRSVGPELALHGGEDYELLFTAPQGKHIPAEIAGTPITEIGRITRKRGIFIREGGKTRRLKAQGWEHFRS
jgi:thiamine-monophosphate kinase